MCGFAGFDLRNDVDESDNKYKGLLQEMLQVIHHRGPDTQGEWSSKRVFIGHKRLSIVDISFGHQPMSYYPGLVLAYNGEIYNADLLRKQIELRGYSFKSTNSDTEVLYLGYLAFGQKIFKMISGMFSFCLLDENLDRIYFVRDPSGIKPLYIYEGKEFLAFSSEPKAFKIFGVETDLNDKQSLYSYFLDRATHAPKTFFKGVKKISNGSIVEYRISDLFQFNNRLIEPLHKFEESLPEFKLPKNKLVHALDLAIKRQVIADVKVGVFLSGGVDSSIIAAIASKYGVRDAFTISTSS